MFVGLWEHPPDCICIFSLCDVRATKQKTGKINKYRFKRKQYQIEGYNVQNVFYTPENGDIAAKIKLLAF